MIPDGRPFVAVTRRTFVLDDVVLGEVELVAMKVQKHFQFIVVWAFMSPILLQFIIS